MAVLAAPVAAAATPESLLATKAVNPNLGSTDAAVDIFSKDYSKAFDLALPPAPQAEVEAMFDRVFRSTPRALDPLRLRQARDVAKLLGLQEPPENVPSKLGTMLTVVGTTAYGFDPFTSVFLFARDRRDLRPLPFRNAALVQQAVAEEHLRLLGQIGIDASQIQFVQTVLISSRGEDTKAPLPDSAEGEVHSFLTYVSRVLAGVQIEGSYAKVVSANKGNVVGLDASWPAIAFHPGVRSPKCKDAATLKRETLPLVQAVAGGNEANLVMAYVLRPVRLGGQRVFVPALKIGVLARGAHDRIEGEDDLEEMVDTYVDLLADRLAYDADDLIDDDSRD